MAHGWSAARERIRPRSVSSCSRSPSDDEHSYTSDTATRAPHLRTMHFPAGGWGFGMGSAAPGTSAMARVIVTRPLGQAGPLVERLEALGHEVVALSADRDSSRCRPGADRHRRATPGSSSRARNGAVHFGRRRTGELRAVAAIGPGTAEALRALGIEPSLVAADSTQEGLAAVFPQPPGPRAGCRPPRAPAAHLIDALGADFIPSTDRELVLPRRLRTAISSCSPPARPPARSRSSGLTSRLSRSGPQTTPSCPGARIVSRR